MAVQLKCGAIFLHVPKTGGSWVTDVLQRQGLVHKQFGHIHADYVRALHYRGAAQTALRGLYDWGKTCLPRHWKAWGPAQQLKRQTVSGQQQRRPFVFCFVRHPLDWYESWWRYMCQRSGFDWSQETDLHSWHPCLALKHFGDTDFNSFIRQVLEKRAGFVSELFASYAQPDVDFVGRQENLCEDLIEVLERLQVSFDQSAIRRAQRVNESKQQVDRILWDAEIRELAWKAEYAALLRYGYAELPQPQATPSP